MATTPLNNWSKLRVAELKNIALYCGLPRTGTKPELVKRLQAAQSATTPAARSKTSTGPIVLSIDLGIRNFAFSLMTLAPSVSSPSGTRGKRQKNKKSPLPVLETTPRSPVAIRLHAWQRLSLLEPSGGLLPKNDDQDEASLRPEAPNFSPPALAKITNTFLQATVLRLNPLPTHILIERQRWRTLGGSSVLEWTLRVNTLEAMLHASLQTLRDVGSWKGEVESIQPRSVAQLFLEADETKSKDVEELSASIDESDEPVGKKSKGPKTQGSKNHALYLKKKGVKIDLLRQWLDQHDDIIQPQTPEAQQMLEMYQKKPNGKSRKKEPMVDTKLDDITDSLLQGIAWLRWRENRAQLSRHGPEELLNLE
ncbi:mitochondrial resolvase Ydc2 [Xylariaceae sp. FL1272]|nr:mitochondrial resolvase Ydc2 [Xylariaceae sp. FL1272]